VEDKNCNPVILTTSFTQQYTMVCYLMAIFDFNLKKSAVIILWIQFYFIFRFRRIIWSSL